MIETTWTTERVALLKSRIDAGLSCAQIAREIGVSRNAVIGKANRLGLSRLKGLGAPRPERTDAPKTQRPRLFSQHRILRALRAEPLPATEEVAGMQRCSLLELHQGKCRWPISDPGAADFGFCGNSAVAGLSYCAAHARMAYQPGSRVRRARPLPCASVGP
jgi:GcrA cell cycle regulator